MPAKLTSKAVRTFQKVLIVGMAAGGPLLFQNCSQATFSSTSPIASAANQTSSSSSSGGSGNGTINTTGSTPVCTLQQSSKNVRVLLMVDNSGSTDTTDPKDVDRVATVKTFLAQYASKSNITYGYSYFANLLETYSMVPNGTFSSNPTTVFGDATNALAALNLFASGNIPKEGSGTQYTLAFNGITSIISNDLAANPDESYIVVFMSDGAPTDLGSGATNQLSGIKTLVSNLVSAVGSNRLSLSSVYFGPATETQAIANLSSMADLGGGLFVNTNTSTSVSIDNLITVPVEVCSSN